MQRTRVAAGELEGYTEAMHVALLHSAPDAAMFSSTPIAAAQTKNVFLVFLVAIGSFLVFSAGTDTQVAPFLPLAFLLLLGSFLAVVEPFLLGHCSPLPSFLAFEALACSLASVAVADTTTLLRFWV